MTLSKFSPLKLVAGLIIFIFLVATACTSNSTESKKDTVGETREQESRDMVARGKYLIAGIGCSDCHSPKIMTQQGPVPDTTKSLSGHPANAPLMPFTADALKPGGWVQMAPDLTAFVGPWGVSFPVNLTPDSATGLGAWTGDNFVQAMRTGKHLGQANGRPILPPMPYFNFAKLTDEDLQAMYMYLRSLPPISNRVPGPIPPDEAAKLAKKG
jgi:hypothetical protein